MPLVSNIPYWNSVVSSVALTYRFRGGEYFNGYPVNDAVNPLAPVDPKVDDFVASYVLHIVIVGNHFGWTGFGDSWTFSWPPPGYVESVDLIRNKYTRWAKYAVFFYGDRYLVNQMIAADAVAGAQFNELMTTTFEQIQEDCVTYADIGFKWMGELSDPVPSSFFFPILDQFYGR